MQKKSLIPTPLSAPQSARRPLELAEPKLPSRWRFVKITFFLIASVARSILARMSPRLARTRYSSIQNASRLRSFMERMGGLWVKVGQILALRRDLFDEEFCSELTRLQDSAIGFPGHHARRIIEEDLGGPVEKFFDDFNEMPLAAASIGQAHRARLRGTTIELVVKVQRPTIVQGFQRDLRYLYRFVWFLSRAGIAPNFRWMDMYWEIENAILEELDYRQEAASLQRMRKQLRSHKIYVPKVFLDLCTDRVLVMEMVQGVYMSEFIKVLATEPERADAWLKENKISRRTTGERLLFSHYQQFLEDNCYHCDLHPGNILLMRNSRITLIDFGSVGSSDKGQLTKLLHVWIAVGSRDYRKVADLFLLLAPSLPNCDLSHIKEKIVRLYRELESVSKIKKLPYHQKSFGRVAGEVVNILGKSGVEAFWDILRSTRASLTLDASLMFLLPEVDYPSMIRRYLVKMRERDQQKLLRPRAIRAQAAKLSEQLDLPTKLAENAYFEGEYVRRRALNYEGYLSKAAHVGGNIFHLFSRGFILIAIAAVMAFLYQHYSWFQGVPVAWLHELLRRFPFMDVLNWILCIGGALYLSREASAMQRVLEAPEASRAGGDRR